MINNQKSEKALKIVRSVKHRRLIFAGLIVAFALFSYSAAEAENAPGSLISPVPYVISIHPTNAVIPANTLRFYVTFSKSMQRGQVAESIWLENQFGKPLKNPFLNLGFELWDSSQKRLTLLIDPGRIKTAVGPNLLLGPVFENGQQYAIVVSDEMRGVDGVATGIKKRKVFFASAAEHQPVDLEKWELALPHKGTRMPLKIQFDRIMDVGTSQRMITIHHSNGAKVEGIVDSHGTFLLFTPSQNWTAGTYHLLVNPKIEDVSGNSIYAPFEKSGTDSNLIIKTKLAFKLDGLTH